MPGDGRVERLVVRRVEIKRDRVGGAVSGDLLLGVRGRDAMVVAVAVIVARGDPRVRSGAGPGRRLGRRERLAVRVAASEQPLVVLAAPLGGDRDLPGLLGVRRKLGAMEAHLLPALDRLPQVAGGGVLSGQVRVVDELVGVALDAVVGQIAAEAGHLATLVELERAPALAVVPDSAEEAPLDRKSVV